MNICIRVNFNTKKYKINMNNFIDKYFSEFTDSLRNIEVTNELNQKIEFDDAISSINDRIKKIIDDDKKVIMVVNGIVTGKQIGRAHV